MYLQKELGNSVVRCSVESSSMELLHERFVYDAQISGVSCSQWYSKQNSYCSGRVDELPSCQCKNMMPFNSIMNLPPGQPVQKMFCFRSLLSLNNPQDEYLKSF